MSKKIYIIAGETSGDFIGSLLIKKLKQKDNSIIFKGVGSSLMKKEGINSLFCIKDIAIIGLVEVLSKIFKIKKLINKTVNDIREFQPDILITIDSPGFNKIVAKRIKKEFGSKITLIHYVAPTVWIWKPKRAEQFAKIFDHIFCLFQFEPKYFEKEGLTSHFVGHSIVESGADKGNKDEFIKKYNIKNNTDIILLMPGSRTTEIKRLLPIFNKVINNIKQIYPNIQVVIPLVEHLKKEVTTFCNEHNLNAILVSSLKDKYNSFKAAKIGIIASGTASIETSLAGLPTIVAYKNNIITDILSKLLIKLKYVSLVNIVADKEIIQEYIQQNCRVDYITKAALDMLKNPIIIPKQQVEDVLKTFGYKSFSPSDIAAQKTLDILNNIK